MPLLVPTTVYDPLALRQTQPAMADHRVICLHTMAGSFVGTDSFFHANGYGGTESHLGIAGSGFTKQWQDLFFTADANYESNAFIISIETADHGESFPPWSGSNVPPWSALQVLRITELLNILCSPEFHRNCPSHFTCHNGIPKVLVPDSCPSRRGIAYHRQGIDHSSGNPNAPGGPWRSPACPRWSKSSGKVCPGDRRIHQLIHDIIPNLNGEEDDMPYSPEDLKRIMKDAIRDTRQAPGFFVVLEGDGDTVYFVTYDFQSKVRMARGGDTHNTVKFIMSQNGWDSGPRSLPPEQLTEIPTVVAE